MSSSVVRAPLIAARASRARARGARRLSSVIVAARASSDARCFVFSAHRYEDETLRRALPDATYSSARLSLEHRVARAGPRRGLRVRRRRRARRGRGRPRGPRGEVDIAPLRGIRQRGLRASARERDQRAARAGVRSVEHQRARGGDDDESESTLVRVARPAAHGKLYARRLGRDVRCEGKPSASWERGK